MTQNSTTPAEQLGEDWFRDRPFLVLTDVDAIQAYLFESVRLRTIAGASHIVTQFDQWLTDSAHQRGASVLCSTGGTGKFLFSKQDDATKFAHDATQEFMDRSVSWHMTTAVIDRFAPDGTARPFSEAVLLGERELEVTKRRGHASGELAAHPLARWCECCGRESVSHHFRLDNDEQFLGSACAKKWIADRDKKNTAAWYVKLIQDARWSQENVPPLAQDFDALAGTDERLSLIVADVNRVGDALRTLKTPFEYQEFSQKLRVALDTTLSDAIQAALSAVGWSIQDQAVLPILVLFHGGDDLVIACRGDLALPLVEKLATRFHELAPKQLPSRSLGMSAAIVTANAGFPFRTAHRIATRMLSEAKREAHLRRADSNWAAGAVDFVWITEANADAETILADRSVIDDKNRALILTGRPYCAGASGPRSFSGLLRACAKLADGDFPTSRLFDLRVLSSSHQINLSGDSGALSQALSEARLRSDYKNWLEGTERREAVKQIWNAVTDELVLSDCFYSEHQVNGQKVDRTCLGDLADVVANLPAKQSQKVNQPNQSPA